ncbi:MAG TPA: VOC family protein [Mycobacteriales bacterium]|jgi:catechol 2,3-dioxygenase-like lactoylglutathione lyase family enzyme|nr:VOC family protein [Mycobacteriales bacterium]
MTTLHPAPPRPASVRGLAAICVDCADPPRLAAFYAALLGAAVEVADDGDAGLYDLDGPNIDFLKVPEAKAGKNRLHLDLRVTDMPQAVELALSLGATLAPDVYDGDSWVVLRDPEGNEFCLLRPRADGGLRYQPES